MNFLSKFVVILLLTIITALTNEYQKSPIVLLDCTNYKLIDFDLPNTLQNNNAQPLSFMTDILFSSDSSVNNKNHLLLFADFASETGEPLFSRYDGANFNREHMAFGGSEINLLQGKLQLKGGYHHLGTYSDSIESQFYKLVSRYNVMPSYANVGKYGISEYMFGACKINLQCISTKSVLNKYGNWILMPVTYDPVYQSGYLYLQDIDYSLGKDSITLSTKLNIEDKYLNQINPSNVKTFNLNLDWNHTVNDNISIGAQILSNSDFSPNILFSLHSCVIVNSSFSMNVKAGVWKNKKSDDSVEFQWQMLQNLKSELSMNYNYTPSENSITYLGTLDTTTYSTNSYHDQQAKLFFQYDSLLNSPVHLQTWFNVSNGYKGYFINDSSNQIFVKQGKINKWFNEIGGKIYIDIIYKQLSICPWAQGNYDITGHLPEELPFESGINLSYSFTGYAPVKTNLSLTYRTPYTWRAIKNGVNIEKSTESLLFCNLSLSVPFISPIFSLRVKQDQFI